MGSLLLVLKSAPEQEQHAHFVWNLAQAAEAQGHKVTVHVFGDGIFNLVPNMDGVGPIGIADAIGNKNIQVMYCNFNVEQRGLKGGQLIEGIRKASTTDASVEFLNNDRVLMISR